MRFAIPATSRVSPLLIGRVRHLIGGLLLTLLMGVPSWAGPLRVAIYDVDLTRRGPGLLLQDITRGKDTQIRAVLEVLERLDADILVLTDIDYDYDGVALSALAERLGKAGHAYPYRFVRRPNTGRPTGLDLDDDGRTGGAGDAQGWGRFAGEGGVAVLSRLPFDESGFQDYSNMLWRDLPGALLPPGMTDAAKAVQRLSSTVHWALPVVLPDGRRLTLLIWSATPPVFDGPEDRNGRRNHDEAAFWQRLMEGELPLPGPNPPFMLIGTANLDTVNGDGRPDALISLLKSPKLHDPAAQMRSSGRAPGASDRTLATADFTARNGPGLLRVDYILPSADLDVTAAGAVWPSDGDPLAPILAAASPHRPVHVDIALP